MSISDRVIAIIAEQAVLEPSDVTPESTLEDLSSVSKALASDSIATAWVTFENPSDGAAPI